MSKQWGHGFNKGIEKGMQFGELIGGGAAEVKACAISARIYLLALALEGAVQERAPKTDTWWAWLVDETKRELFAIAESMPGGVANGIKKYQHEVEEDA